MKTSVLILLTLLVSLSYGLQQDVMQTSDNSVNIKLNADFHTINNDEELIEGTVSQTVALLAEDVDIVINQLSIGLYDKTGNRVEQYNVNPLLDTNDVTSRVYLSNSFTFREMYGFTVNTDIVVEENGLYSLIEAVDFDIVGRGTREIPESISEYFYPSYKALADNYRNSYMVNLPFKRPAMLVISHSGLSQALTPYLRWKRERGIDITVVNKEDIGANANSTQIRNYIRDFYNQAENKPDFLLLIGDVSSNYSIPTFYHPPQNDATDLPYTLIEGDDYFPEILAGRFSVTSSFHLATIVNKTVNHEKSPYLEDPDWMERALVVAGNYATTHPIPITPVLTSQWVAQLLERNGYDVTTVFWWPGDGGYGTTPIIDALNRGVQVVSYRGWGDANGWHFPQFRIRHLSEVDTGPKNPYVTSFVCNTGDFANPTIDPSFGEAFMRMGTPASPNGAVAFLGPSDLYTSTQFNNALIGGFYWGYLEEDIRNFSSATLRSKMEIYLNFVHDRDEGGWVDHYFKVYNVLSDPTLNMWKLIPEQMNIDIPSQITSTDTHIEFDTPGLKGGYVTLTRDQEEYQTFRIDGDYIFMPLEVGNTEDIWITVSCENYLPVQQTIEVIPSDNVTMIDYDFGGSEILPGDDITLNVTLKNTGDSVVNNVDVELLTPSQYVNIVEGNYNFGDIGAGETAQGSFVFNIVPECPRHTAVQFSMALPPANNVVKIQTIVGGVLFSIDDHHVHTDNGVLNPGETGDIEVTITNIGEISVQNLTAMIIPGTNAVTVQQEPISFGNLAVGESASATFSATVAADAYNGRQVYFQMDFSDEIGRTSTSYFNTTIGEVTNTDPTGPCEYGYYAYDSFDVGYDFAPVYDWVEIDPETGGPGTDMWLHDDGTETIDLPFTFGYYGNFYDQLSICSNGWVSLEPTWMIDFRNWSIPTPISPYGIIAPFWDDLKGMPDVGDSLRVAYHHDEVNNRFIVTWLDAYNRGNMTPSGLEKMQLILEPREGRDGDLVFQYHTVWNQSEARNYSTTGIQSPTNKIGLQYAFNNSYPPSATPIQEGLAIRFTTDTPDPYTHVEDVTAPVNLTGLRQNYPNPFNPETVIEFDLAQSGVTSLAIYNVRGQKVRSLVDGELQGGTHRIAWDGKDDQNREVGSGVYLYKLQTANQTETRRMILMK